jgi:hypothetical protein
VVIALIASPAATSVMTFPPTDPSDAMLNVVMSFWFAPVWSVNDALNTVMSLNFIVLEI